MRPRGLLPDRYRERPSINLGSITQQSRFHLWQGVSSIFRFSFDEQSLCSRHERRLASCFRQGRAADPSTVVIVWVRISISQPDTQCACRISGRASAGKCRCSVAPYDSIFRFSFHEQSLLRRPATVGELFSVRKDRSLILFHPEFLIRNVLVERTRGRTTPKSGASMAPGMGKALHSMKVCFLSPSHVKSPGLETWDVSA